MYPKIEIKEIQTGGLSQIYHSGLEYTVLNKNKEMLIKWCFCKDYITDLFWSSWNKVNASIYGMSYDFKEQNAQYRGSRLAIRNSTDNNFVEGIEKSVLLVNNLFKMIDKVPEVKIKNQFNYMYTEADSNCVKKEVEKTGLVINLPSYFLIAPPLLSLFTLLIRCGVGYKGTDTMDYLEKLRGTPGIQSNDVIYLNSSLVTIKHLVKEKTSSLFSRKGFLANNWPKEKDINFMHNQSGIVSFSNYFKANNKPYLDYIRGI